jgi:hypothetical protein
MPIQRKRQNAALRQPLLQIEAPEPRRAWIEIASIA